MLSDCKLLLTVLSDITSLPLLLLLFPWLWLLLQLLQSFASNRENPLNTFDGNWKPSSFFASPLPHTPLAFFHGNRRRPSEKTHTHTHTDKMVECICQKSTTLHQGQTCDFIFPHHAGLVLSQQKLIFCLWEIIHSSLLSLLGKISVQILAQRSWQVFPASYLLSFFPHKYLLSTYYVPGRELVMRKNTEQKHAWPGLCEVYSLGNGEEGKINTN